MNPLATLKKLRIQATMGALLALALLWWLHPVGKTQLPVSSKPSVSKEKAPKSTTDKDFGIRFSVEDQNMPETPVKTPIWPGAALFIEQSRASRDQAKIAVDNFITNAKRAGLKLEVTGEAHMRTKVAKNRITGVRTDDTYFNATTSPTGEFASAVDMMQLLGNDANGAFRGINVIMSASASNRDRQLFADTSLYPIVSSSSDAYPAVAHFLALQFPNGSYVLDHERQLQLGWRLPFITYTFVTPEERGKVDPVDLVEITVRIGGNDLNPGEAALVGYETTGVVTHGQKISFQKPPLSLLERPRSP
jgi:hypothetical protein